MLFFKKNIEIIILCLMITCLFVSAAIYIYLPLFIFPLFNGLLLFTSLLIFKSKYRLISITFAIPISALMSIQGAGFGSFLTWNILFYLIVLLFEKFVSKKQEKINFNLVLLLFSYALIVVYILILQLFKIKEISKFFSVSIYWAVPLLYLLDQKAIKPPHILLLSLSLSHILSNVFCCLFIYIIPNQTVPFLSTYIKDYVHVFEVFGLADFRYPGLSGDPNHLGISVLFTTTLLLIYLTKYKTYKLIFTIFIFLLNIFGLLGGSKTYLMCLLLVILWLVGYCFIKSRNKVTFITLSLSVLFMAFILVMSIDTLSKTILRFFALDTRQGFLEALTTSRLSIWKTAIMGMLDNPLKLLFGHGVWSLTPYGAAAHNLYIQIIWDLGLIGIIIFGIYIYSLFKYNQITFKKFYAVVLVLICSYGFGLHIIYNESFLSCFGITLLLFAHISKKEYKHYEYYELEIT